MCLEDNVVYVTAIDGDNFPNSAPFTFRVIQENSKEKWTVEYLNGKSSSGLVGIRYVDKRTSERAHVELMNVLLLGSYI